MAVRSTVAMVATATCRAPMAEGGDALPTGWFVAVLPACRVATPAAAARVAAVAA